MHTSKPKHSSFTINDCIITDKQKIVNEFTKFVVNIGPQIAANIINTCDPLSYVDTFMHSICICNMSEYDVKHITLLFKCTTAGWDNWPACLGKQCIDVYITPLTYIINQSMTEVSFPDMLKQQGSYRYTNLVKINILIIRDPYQFSHFLQSFSFEEGFQYGWSCNTSKETIWIWDQKQRA